VLDAVPAARRFGIVGLGGLVAAQLDDRDPVQGGVELAIAGAADWTVSWMRPDQIGIGATSAFAAARTITLPNNGNQLFNGLYVEITFVAGSINGANTRPSCPRR
jgi:hypothetical protein